jgi:hypothetical protein
MDDKFASRRFPATLVTGSTSLPMRKLSIGRAWRLESCRSEPRQTRGPVMHDEIRDLRIDGGEGRGDDGWPRTRGFVVVSELRPSSRPGQPFKIAAHLRIDAPRVSDVDRRLLTVRGPSAAPGIRPRPRTASWRRRADAEPPYEDRGRLGGIALICEI